MSASEITAASLVRLEERLRQESETFNQRKKQQASWFNLKLCMGYIAAIFLPAIVLGCCYVLYMHDTFPATVVGSARTVLVVDVVGLLVVVWKMVLNQRSFTQLEPVTSSDVSEFEQASE